MMNSSLSSGMARILLAALLLSFPCSLRAQEVMSAGEFAGRILKELQGRKLSKVVVVDLADENAQITPRSHAVSQDIFSFFGDRMGKIKFFYPYLWGRENPPDVGLSPDSAEIAARIQKICNEKHADAVLKGRIQVRPNGVLVSITVADARAGSVLAVSSAILPLETPEPLFWHDPNSHDEPTTAQAGKDGISIPRCFYQPNPHYSEKARSMRVTGKVVLKSVLTKEGKFVHIQVVTGLGYGLDQNAIEAVRNWKCTPARDRSGNPVAVWIPIEVEFRLLKYK